MSALGTATVTQQTPGIGPNGLLRALRQRIATLVSIDDGDTAWRERHEAIRWFYGIENSEPSYREICRAILVDPGVFRNALLCRTAEVAPRLLNGDALEAVVPEATGRLPIPQAKVLSDDACVLNLWRFQG